VASLFYRKENRKEKEANKINEKELNIKSASIQKMKKKTGYTEKMLLAFAPMTFILI